jgi:hypothetical protein
MDTSHQHCQVISVVIMTVTISMAQCHASQHSSDRDRGIVHGSHGCSWQTNTGSYPSPCARFLGKSLISLSLGFLIFKMEVFICTQGTFKRIK